MLANSKLLSLFKEGLRYLNCLPYAAFGRDSFRGKNLCLVEVSHELVMFMNS